MPLQVFAESQNTRVSGHDKNLSASHIALLEELHDFMRELRRAVINGLRACRVDSAQPPTVFNRGNE